MIKVLFISGGFPNMPCGVGDYTFSLSQELTRLEVDVHVLTTKDLKVNTDPGFIGQVQIHSLVPSWSFSDISTIKHLVQKIQPDIVHIQYPANFGKANRKLLANFLGIISRGSSNRKTKIVTTLHEFSERRLRWKARAVVNILSSDVVICVNQFDLRHVRRYINPKNLVVHIPIASNINHKPISRAIKQQLRRKNNFSESDIVLAYFGFITPVKGFEILIKAIHNLKLIGYPIKLLILTNLSPTKDRYHLKIERLIQYHGLQEDCLLGDDHYSNEDVSFYLQCADIAVLPFVEGASERRGSLLAVLAHRLPTITTYSPHTPHDFINGENMILIPPNNTPAIAQAVEKLVRDKKLQSTLSDGAEQLSKKYSFDKIAEQTLNVYQNALD